MLLDGAVSRAFTTISTKGSPLVSAQWRLRHLYQQLPKCIGRRRLSSGAPDQPEVSILAYMLALLLVERGQAEEALRWMVVAASELPQNTRIRYNHGLLLARLQRPEEARAAVLAGLEKTPADADLLYAMIYLQASSGNREQALAYLRRLEQTAPEDARLGRLKQQLSAH